MQRKMSRFHIFLLVNALFRLDHIYVSGYKPTGLNLTANKRHESLRFAISSTRN